MNDKLIIELLKQSVDLLYKNDSYLIEHSVHEQDISHRIAYYFENLLNNYSWYKKSSFNVIKILMTQNECIVIVVIVIMQDAIFINLLTTSIIINPHVNQILFYMKEEVMIIIF